MRRDERERLADEDYFWKRRGKARAGWVSRGKDSAARVKEWIQENVKTEKPFSSLRVLDAGAGTGSPLSRAFAELGARVVAVDLSRVPLKKKFFPRVAVQGNVARLPFRSNAFDVLVSEWLHGGYSVLPVDHPGFHGEFLRVLKPGGHAIHHVIGDAPGPNDLARIGFVNAKRHDYPGSLLTVYLLHARKPGLKKT